MKMKSFSILSGIVVTWSLLAFFGQTCHGLAIPEHHSSEQQEPALEVELKMLKDLAAPAVQQASNLSDSISYSTGLSKFSDQDLMELEIMPKISNDVDMDPCKAGSFIGDIANPTEEYERERRLAHRNRRAATARAERVWDFAVIPYEIDANFSGGHKSLFKQAISIGKNCDKFGIVVHELGHVVGFWHEHTRPDRDQWVTIYNDNIMAGQEYNFNKLSHEEVNSMGLKYDYDSIMHYSRNTFSRNTYLDTILPREDLPENRENMPEIGQRIRLSVGDIAQTMALYGCPVCGRTFQDTKVSFGSPQHPSYTVSPRFEQKPFKMGDECQWRILATHGEKIILNITSLDIPSSQGCQTNFLEIRDGYWHKSALLARLCGNETPSGSIMSTGSRMLMVYHTNENSPLHSGFTANYEAVCGGDLEMDSGHLESPNYPDDYPPDKECIWKITVPQGFQVALKFQFFEIENHDSCLYDYIEIRDGNDENAPLVGSFCGYKMPSDIKSSSNKLYVKFVSDTSVQKAGFSASFMKEYDECASPEGHGCQHECINTLGDYKCKCDIGYELHSDEKHCENACGGLIDTTNGTITSPSFPDLYPANKNCVWEILAPPQWRITINFTHFDIEGNNQDCEYDSLTVSSKMGSGEIRRHGVYCGSRKR